MGVDTAGAEQRRVEVAVSLPIPKVFTYLAPGTMELALGDEVLVPFGGGMRSGVVLAAEMTGPGAELPPGMREVVRILSRDALPADVVALCRFVSDYYDAPIGEALKLAAAPGAQSRVTKRYQWTESGRHAWEHSALPPAERDVLAALSHGRPKALAAVHRPTIPSLLARGWLVESVAVDQRVAARHEAMMELVEQYHRGEELLPQGAGKGANAKKAQVLELLREAPNRTMARGELLARCPGAGAALRALVGSGAIRQFSRELKPGVATIGTMERPSPPPELTAAQSAALATLLERAQTGFSTTLVFGVTGSGKTELYLRLIAEAHREGKGALVLVPEISLTPLLASRFRARFGDQVAVLHSGLRPRERFDEWQRLRQGGATIAVGARSAVFAPVRNLGVVVVDEEHDASFKQDEGVRYHGRDVAVMRAKLAKACCVLGSATPSLETYHAAATGKYGMVALPERAAASAMPDVDIVDLRQFRPAATSMLTAPLAEAIDATLAKKEQVILLLNRRGFAPAVLCEACGALANCIHCAVSLTLHREPSRLVCHYCGYAEPMRSACASCGSKSVAPKGTGTAQIAEVLASQFPGARIGRLDRDIGGKDEVEAVLAQVGRGELDILVGTQMVAKGHDFPEVTLVGVLCADIGLSMPDFRASERTFQLLSQVAGRAGRARKPGRVIIQSYRPQADAVRFAMTHDYEGFYQAEIASRGELGYPPFGRVVAWHIDAPTLEVAQRAAAQLAGDLAAAPEVVVVGPAPAPLTRLKGRFRFQVWVRGPVGALRRAIELARSSSAARVGGARLTIDVDPVSTW